MLEMKHMHVVQRQMFCTFDHGSIFLNVFAVLGVYDYVAGLLLLHVCLLCLTILDVVCYNFVISFRVQKVMHKHTKTHEHFTQLKEIQTSFQNSDFCVHHAERRMFAVKRDTIGRY